MEANTNLAALVSSFSFLCLALCFLSVSASLYCHSLLISVISLISPFTVCLSLKTLIFSSPYCKMYLNYILTFLWSRDLGESIMSTLTLNGVSGGKGYIYIYIQIYNHTDTGNNSPKTVSQQQLSLHLSTEWSCMLWKTGFSGLGIWHHKL